MCPSAAVDLSVRLVQSTGASKYAGLINAVLRRCAEGQPLIDEVKARRWTFRPG